MKKIKRIVLLILIGCFTISTQGCISFLAHSSMVVGKTVYKTFKDDVFKPSDKNKSEIPDRARDPAIPDAPPE
jgi:hypothetical protein